ncbi:MULTISPECIES: PAS domain S-box protein [unclassified Coleofasciculus]|uniref:PAS domain S-box protein n=1 Tax=unclassified Coleofasciculus TaxID=2692782 RepID=UPI0018823ED6|nr:MULTISPECIES: PAS domain S-box protein [unclassified Coleofasciculus]MBE9126487.1 PAS domain S-box protein [Coleofasciculus sp. LEGE 07081]MBE9149916.1 PAS domain S-box protein [Coleofasciculus sp. LEGE 07092]
MPHFRWIAITTLGTGDRSQTSRYSNDRVLLQTMQSLSQTPDRAASPLSIYSPALSDIVDRHPLTVAPDTAIANVLAQMSQAWGSHCQLGDSVSVRTIASSCVLVTEAGQLVGVFTERDVVRLTAQGGNLAGVTVRQVMSEPLHLLKSHEFRDIFTVLSSFKQYQIRHLPVVDDQGYLLGVITPSTLRSVLQPANLLKLRTVDEVMKTEVVCARADASVLSLAQLMAEQGVSCVVVCESSGIERQLKPVGIVTERDIVQFQVLELNLAQLQASEVMSQPLFCLNLTDNLWVAHQEMQRRYVRRLLVTDTAGQLQGIVTQTTLLQVLDPMEMYSIIESLQQTVCQLEAEKVELLQSRNSELEGLVQSRTGELQRQGERERLLSAIAQRIRQFLNLQEIFEVTVNEVRQLLHCDRVLVYQIESDWNGTIVAESVENFTSVKGTQLRDTYFQDTRGAEYLEGRRQVTADIYHAGLHPCHLELLKRFEVKAILTVPIIIDEQLWGLLVAHHCATPRQWQPEELDLLEQLSVQIAIAIQQARAFQKIQTELAERQKAEAVAKATQERLQYLLSASPTVLYSCQATIPYPTTFISENIRALTGYTRQDFCNQADFWITHIHPDDNSAIFVGLEQLFQQGYTTLEYRFQHQNQAYIWVQDSLRLVRDEKGNILEIVGSCIDISHRVNAQKQAQTSEKLLTSFYESAPVGLCIADEQWRFVRVNPAFCKLSGYQAEELLGQAFTDLLPPDSPGEWQVRRPDGTVLDLTIANGSTIQQAGRYFRVITITDITEQKKVGQAIQSMAERLSTIIETVSEGITLSDERGYFSIFNYQMQKITGYTRQEANRYEDFLTLLYPDPVLYQMVKQWQKQLGKKKKLRNIETTIQGKNGNRKTLLVSLSVIHQDDQELFLSAYRDISDRKQAEEALQRLNEQLENRVRQRTNELEKTVEQLHREITEREYTERALQESHRKINDILESITEGFFALDRQWNFTHFNSMLEPLLQRPVSELIGRNIWEVFPESVGTQFDRAYHQAAEEQKPVAFEACYPPVNVWFEVRVYPSKEGLSVYFRDISDRKEAELALQESQRFVQRIAESNPNIIYIYDLGEQRNVYANREIGTILGYTPAAIQEMGSQLFQNLMHPDDLAQLPNNLQRLNAADDGDIIEGEYRMKHTNGQWRWLYSWDTVFSRTDEGKPKQILGTASDITARKQAEEALRQQIERERLMGAMSQRIRQSFDLNRILKTTVEEVQQLLATDRVLVYQLFAEGTGCVIAEGVTPGLSFPPEAFPETCYQAYVQGRVYAVTNRDHILPCMVEFMEQFDIQAELVVPIVQHDILWGLLIAHQCSHPREWQPWEIELLSSLATQLAIAIKQCQLYEQLRQNNEILASTNAELARATRLKDEFLANMSHELRTPLNAILGLSESLQEEVYGSLTPKQRKSLATIEKSGKHLLELINDILDLAKIESGKLELQFVPVSIPRLCESSLTFVKQQAFKKRIKLNSQLLEGLEPIELDERRMRQVLINLLSNAVKFTPEGGSVTVAVQVETSDNTDSNSLNSQNADIISISIIDTGIGIAKEDMEKLFQSFVQIDSSLSRRHEGTGLGLSLVRRLVELHGGSVAVKSEVGKGSCFTVRLPWRRSKRLQETTNYQLPPQILPLERATNPKHSDTPLILIAEDNETNVVTLFDYLSEAGYQVIVAKQGREAVKMAQEYQPSLILMDIQMPEMDGLTATQRIRAHKQTATIPIIALTALAMPGDEEKCLAAGASSYMTKPVSLKQLLATMKMLLRE